MSAERAARSGLEPFHPPARLFAEIANSVVKAVLLVQPELVAERLQPVSAPPGGTDHGLALQRVLELAGSLVELVSTADRPALGRCHCPQLGGPWAALEIPVGLRLLDSLDGPFQADLTPQRLPVKQQRRMGVGRQFLSLATVIVAVEDEAPLVPTFHQHH